MQKNKPRIKVLKFNTVIKILDGNRRRFLILRNDLIKEYGFKKGLYRHIQDLHVQNDNGEYRFPFARKNAIAIWNVFYPGPRQVWF
jgi:hypothetical protein